MDKQPTPDKMERFPVALNVCLVTARGRGAVQVRDGARRLAEGDAQEVHFRGDATVQANKRRRVNDPTERTTRPAAACERVRCSLHANST